MKIDKGSYIHHHPDFVECEVPLPMSEAVSTLSFLAADRLYMAWTWWLHEAEEIVEAYSRGINLSDVDSWPTCGEGDNEYLVPTWAFAASWEGSCR